MKFTKQLSAIIFVAAPIAAQTTTDVYSVLPIDLTASVTLPVETDGTDSGCPTVTEVAERCATCPVPQCLTVLTLTQSCGCPTPAPTEYLSLQCRDVCGRIGCSTSYTVIPGEESCDGSGSGTATVTATEVASTDSTTVAATPTETTATGTDPSTGVGSGAITSEASSSATPNAAGRLRVPFKFW
ncbi:uncharacterized protein ColSpa_06531 [Colletotrichum spaethianum]|uniref:Uncharacterized protein n=1 Tax=Colletotrichum spaethianum TaxID=700344 RepID=A0AA37LGZ1_9PEZI|nr:uncharacterized protein ColSpa_06531 [Colletotrichum spaethianum]GKT46350.1 hypothetical protein ColSpa_06531 [Colletotrichum spaethianum]